MSADRTPLQPFLAPSGVAVFGAAPNPRSLGRAFIANLASGALAGKVFPVSAKHREIAGIACSTSLAAIEAPLSLALIASPAQTVPGIIEDCARRGIRAAIVASGGLRPGTAAGDQLTALAAHHGVRLFGPVAMGIALPHRNINMTPIEIAIPSGNLALVSQSAAICSSILDWNIREGCGFSAVFVPGESDDLELPEILDYLASDPQTESILLYLEGLRDARGFMSAVRAAASVKPVIAVKAGHTRVSTAVAAAHSGARSDRDDAFDAALRRAGVLRVQAIGEMFSAARALTTPRKPRGNRLAIVSNGGGPAVMALDQAGKLDIALAQLSPATCRHLGERLPISWSSGNPVDVGFKADTAHFAEAVGCCLDDAGTDGVLAILTPNGFVDPLECAEATIAAAARTDKPVLACWLGERNAGAARAAFAAAGLPTFRTPENAVGAFAFTVNWVHNQALRLEVPPALSSYTPPDSATARAILDAALSDGRHSLGLPDAKALLTAFHIPVSQTLLAGSPTEAIQVADRLGYPLTMRAAGAAGSVTSVRQRLRSAPEVAMAYRDFAAAGAAGVFLEPQVWKPEGRWLTIGIRHDRLFGPVISLSESGIAPIIYDARSVALPPLNARLADAMLHVPHVARLLGPLPGKPAVALDPLRDILLRISEMASELPALEHLEIVSLIADDVDAIAVDVIAEVRASGTLPASADRYGHMAICPYPAQLEAAVTLRDGTACTLRALRPEDTAALQDFIRGLSPRSKRLRFFSAVSELSRHEIAHYAQIDYGRDMVVIAIDDRQHILGEARYSILADRRTGDFAIAVGDDMAGKGLGALLMTRLIDAAREQGLATIRGQVLADNEAMVALMERLDFRLALTDDESTLEVSRSL